MSKDTSKIHCRCLSSESTEEKIYGMHKEVGLQLFWSGTPTFSSGTPTFCQMGVLNSCFQNPSESSVIPLLFIYLLYKRNCLNSMTHDSKYRLVSLQHEFLLVK